MNFGEESIIKISANPNGATRHDYMQAIVYLSDRVTKLEQIMADRTRAFTPPTSKEVEEYAKTIKFDLNGESFCAHYEARGWMMGKSKMKSWKAAVRTWKSRRDETPVKPQSRLPDNLSQRNEQY